MLNDATFSLTFSWESRILNMRFRKTELITRIHNTSSLSLSHILSKPNALLSKVYSLLSEVNETNPTTLKSQIVCQIDQISTLVQKLLSGSPGQSFLTFTSVLLTTISFWQSEKSLYHIFCNSKIGNGNLCFLVLLSHSIFFPPLPLSNC